MNTCGTCRFFGNRCDPVMNEEYDLVDSDYHVCDFVEQAQYFKSWKNAAHVIDGSGYYAALCVKEDFGCNQWQAK